MFSSCTCSKILKQLKGSTSSEGIKYLAFAPPKNSKLT